MGREATRTVFPACRAGLGRAWPGRTGIANTGRARYDGRVTEKPPPVNLVDLGFLDARIKLIDIAAFLDRVQRHGQDGDYRVRALRAALAELSTAPVGRARRVLEALSDPSTAPIPAATVQGAFGAPAPVRT